MFVWSRYTRIQKVTLILAVLTVLLSLVSFAVPIPPSLVNVVAGVAWVLMVASMVQFFLRLRADKREMLLVLAELDRDRAIDLASLSPELQEQARMAWAREKLRELE